MLVVEHRGDDQHAGHHGGLRRAAMAGEGSRRERVPAEAREQEQRDRHACAQAQDRRLAFGVQEQHGEQGHPGHAGERRESGGRIEQALHTRSLFFSAIRPVGRQAMKMMTTAKANTSL